jgi:undecaprenyl-diphosphatase
MNQNIFFFFYNPAHQSQLFDQFVIFTADVLPYIVAISALLFLLIKKKKREIFFVFFSSGLAWILAKILKILIQTSRPFDILPNVHALFTENGYAFPSGHAAFFSALAVALFFYNKKVGYVFMFLALLIGLARITAGVHFPIDILGGFVLGSLIAYFVKNV